MFSVHRKAVQLVLFVFILSTTLLGCSTEKKEQNAESDTQQTVKTVTLSWPRDIGPMNPHVYNPSQLIAQSMIYEPLVRYAEGGKLEPASCGIVGDLA